MMLSRTAVIVAVSLVCLAACRDSETLGMPVTGAIAGTGTAGSTAGTSAAGGGTAGGGMTAGGADKLPADVALPIVFVHGFAGSASQYESQAMRFIANGYPAERIRAFDHDGAGFNTASFVSGVDGVVDT